MLPVDRVQRPAVVLVPILHRRMEENFVSEIRPNREPVVCLPVQVIITIHFFVYMKFPIMPYSVKFIKHMLTHFFEVDGHWSDWMRWSPCSVTCGDGSKTRARMCDNPAPSNGGKICSGNAYDMQQCSETICPGLLSDL